MNTGLRTETDQHIYDKLRGDCRSKAVNSCGYAYIFEVRTEKLAKRIKNLSLFGYLPIVIVGILAVTYKFEPQFINCAIYIITPLTIIQFIISFYAFSKGWDDELVYSIESNKEYRDLSSSFKDLAEYPPKDFDSLKRIFDLTLAIYDSRGGQHRMHNITQKEKNMGTRYGLRMFQYKCSACDKLPIDMVPTECPVCGKF